MKKFLLQIGRYAVLTIMLIGCIVFTVLGKMHTYDYFSLSCAVLALIYQILDHHKLGKLEDAQRTTNK